MLKKIKTVYLIEGHAPRSFNGTDLGVRNDTDRILMGLVILGSDQIPIHINEPFNMGYHNEIRLVYLSNQGD